MIGEVRVRVVCAVEDGRAGERTARSAAPSLIASPAALGAGELGDGLTAVMMLMSRSAQADLTEGKQNVIAEKSARDAALKRQEEAIAREKANTEGGKGFFHWIVDTTVQITKDIATLRIDDAGKDFAADVKEAWNSPAFWHELASFASTVAKVAGVVGAVALSVASCGAGAPGAVLLVSALVLSAGGSVVSQTRALDGVLGEGASQKIGLGMSLAGAAMGGVGAFAGVGSTASSALTSAGAAATATSGGASVVAGGATMRVAGFDADALRARADATAARQSIAQDARVIEWLIDAMKDVTEAKDRAARTIADTIATRDTTLLDAASAVGRA